MGRDRSNEHPAVDLGLPDGGHGHFTDRHPDLPADDDEDWGGPRPFRGVHDPEFDDRAADPAGGVVRLSGEQGRRHPHGSHFSGVRQVPGPADRRAYLDILFRSAGPVRAQSRAGKMMTKSRRCRCTHR